MQYKYAEIGDTVYFWFAANTTAGAAGDGATPLYDVRLAGALANAAPTAEGTPTLLTHANYSDGVHEIAIDTTGYAAGEYAVFCSLTISTVNPAGFCGSFKLRTAGTGALLVTTPDTQKVDLNTFKTKAITCANAITVLANVGFAGAPGAENGPATVAAGNVKLAQTVDLTAGQSIAASSVPALVQADVRTAVGLASANLDTQIAALPTDADVTAAVPTAAAIGTDAASKVLVTPAQKIVTDANGKVTYANAAPPTAADVKTAVEADGSKLDHLWEMTVDDAGVRQLTANALELGPGGGTGLTAQQTRDAMKLAPTAGDPAAGSVDKHLDDIPITTGVRNIN